MKKWIVEVCKKDDLLLINAIKKAGFEVEKMKYIPFSNQKYNIEKDTVVYGSANLMEVLLNKTKGIWYNNQIFLCTQYYPVFKNLLFNYPYIQMPFKCLDKKIFGNAQCKFIRPDHPLKVFKAQVFDKAGFSNKDGNFRYTKQDDVIIVSDAKKVNVEWRFIVCKNKIVTASQYHSNNKLCCDIYVPQKAIDKCQEIINMKYDFPDVFVVDICSDFDDECYLLELGPFNCAGLYSCDRNAIVKEISKL